MVAVEVDNRSGQEVDEQGAIELARRVLAAEGVDNGELGIHFVEPAEIQRLKREHLGSTRQRTRSHSRSTSASGFRTGSQGSSATRSSARRSWGRSGGGRSSMPSCTCVGHDHGPEMEARERMHRQ